MGKEGRQAVSGSLMCCFLSKFLTSSLRSFVCACASSRAVGPVGGWGAEGEIAHSPLQISFGIHPSLLETFGVQGQPLGIDIMYLVLGNRNMQVRFGLKVVWES